MSVVFFFVFFLGGEVSNWYVHACVCMLSLRLILHVKYVRHDMLFLSGGCFAVFILLPKECPHRDNKFVSYCTVPHCIDYPLVAGTDHDTHNSQLNRFAHKKEKRKEEKEHDRIKKPTLVLLM